MPIRPNRNRIPLRPAPAGTGIAAFLLALLMSTAAASDDKPHLTWLTPNLPPAYMAGAGSPASGYIDQAEQYFHQRMTSFRHQRVEATFKRAIQAMSDKDGYCHSGLLHTADRARHILLSRPAYIQLGIGLVTDRNQTAHLQTHIDDSGSLDLEQYLHGPNNRLHVVKGRSYTATLDKLLYKHNHKLALSTTSKQALDLFAGGRHVDILEYPIFVEYRLRKEQQKRDWAFYPLKGSSTYLRIFFGCSKGPIGQQAIQDINKIISDTALDGKAAWQLLYLDWLGPESQKLYHRIFDEDDPLRRNLPQ